VRTGTIWIFRLPAGVMVSAVDAARGSLIIGHAKNLYTALYIWFYSHNRIESAQHGTASDQRRSLGSHARD
jgi:hypothetical protein